MGFHSANFGLPRPFCSRIGSRHARDKQTDEQTDGQRDIVHHFIMPLPTEVGGITIQSTISSVGPMHDNSDAFIYDEGRTPIQQNELFNVAPLYSDSCSLYSHVTAPINCRRQIIIFS